jgi:hypothetical protein
LPSTRVMPLSMGCLLRDVIIINYWNINPRPLMYFFRNWGYNRLYECWQ